MYRRRHHCRMCGQIFCNQCSSFYIEQGVIGQTVRCCRLCYDQLGASYDQDIKPHVPLDKRVTSRGAVNPSRRQSVGQTSLGVGEEKSHTPTPSSSSSSSSRGLGAQGQGVVEAPEDREASISSLEQRATTHLHALVHLLVSQSSVLKTLGDTAILSTWEGIIVRLVKEVVNYVDPDVRSGDGLDIRPYVKLKVIAGGSLTDNAFINGVVFRKNVSHKKMATEKSNPRLLLLGGVSASRV